MDFLVGVLTGLPIGGLISYIMIYRLVEKAQSKPTVVEDEADWWKKGRPDWNEE